MALRVDMAAAPGKDFQADASIIYQRKNLFKGFYGGEQQEHCAGAMFRKYIENRV